MNSPGSKTTMDDLAKLVREMTRQVESLWQAVDDLREEVFAEFQHLRGEPLDEEMPAASPPFQLTSMPQDPCDPEFHKKVNKVGVEQSGTPRSEPATPSDSTEPRKSQRGLW